MCHVKAPYAIRSMPACSRLNVIPRMPKLKAQRRFSGFTGSAAATLLERVASRVTLLGCSKRYPRSQVLIVLEYGLAILPEHLGVLLGRDELHHVVLSHAGKLSQKGEPYALVATWGRLGKVTL